MIHFFTVLVGRVHHTFPDFSRLSLIHSSLIARPNWLLITVSLSIKGESCMPKSGLRRDGCPYLNADWFCASCGRPGQTKVDGRGAEDDCLRLLSAWQSMHTISWAGIHMSRSFCPIYLAQRCSTPSVYCHQLKREWIQRGRLFFSSVWRDLM